jgi:hypothetical protein
VIAYGNIFQHSITHQIEHVTLNVSEDDDSRGTTGINNKIIIKEIQK